MSKRNPSDHTPDHPCSPETSQSPSPETIGTSRNIAPSQEVADTAPRIKVTRDKKKSAILLDCKDPVAGAQLMKALGAEDLDFLKGTILQLVRTCERDGVIDEDKLNYMISIVKGIKPRDQIEAMLAAEMAVIHTAMMKYDAWLGH